MWEMQNFLFFFFFFLKEEIYSLTSHASSSTRAAEGWNFPILDNTVLCLPANN
jgi:hypothetical protein